MTKNLIPRSHTKFLEINFSTFDNIPAVVNCQSYKFIKTGNFVPQIWVSLLS